MKNPEHKYDYIDCFYRKICWVIGEYSSCNDDKPCEDYLKSSDVVVNKK